MTIGTLLGTPNREPQEYSRNIIDYKDPGRYIPTIFLLCSWGSLFGVPIEVPLLTTVDNRLTSRNPSICNFACSTEPEPFCIVEAYVTRIDRTLVCNGKLFGLQNSETLRIPLLLHPKP